MLFQEDNKTNIIGEYIPSKKNVIVADLYKNLGFKKASIQDLKAEKNLNNNNSQYFVKNIQSFEEHNHEITIRDAI